VISVDPPLPKRAPVERTPSLWLIQATAKALLFSDGNVVVIARLKPEECEHLAIKLRAETGVVPYGLWIAMTSKARIRLASMTSAMAWWILTCENKMP